MKASLSLAAFAASLLSFVTGAAAQQFYLTLHSSTNVTYNGTILEACDVPGARTALCAHGNTVANGTTTNNVFSFRQISGGQGLRATGFVQWIRLSSSGNTTYNLGFAGQSSSNVVSQELKTASPPYGGYVAWNGNTLSIPDLYNDITNTQQSTSVPTGYYRWQICDKTYLTGNVPSLSWQLGKYAPENPTCRPITVQRQYV